MGFDRGTKKQDGGSIALLIFASLYLTWVVTCAILYATDSQTKIYHLGQSILACFQMLHQNLESLLVRIFLFHMLQSELYSWSLIHSCMSNSILSTSIWSPYLCQWLIPVGTKLSGNSKQLPTYILFENAEEVARFPEYNLEAKASIPVVTKVQTKRHISDIPFLLSGLTGPA